MGSAADAVLHLLAYAMTAPDLDRATLLTVISFMQGPGLAIVAPLIVSFFAGGAMLVRALAAGGSRHGPCGCTGWRSPSPSPALEGDPTPRIVAAGAR